MVRWHDGDTIHATPNAGALREYILAVLDNTTGERNHLFLSNVINRMISDGIGFVAHLASDCAQCGTPEKLEQFMSQVSAGKALTLPKRRFCFALDNVLVTPPDRPGDLTSVRPIEKNVQLVRELHESGTHRAGVLKPSHSSDPPRRALDGTQIGAGCVVA